MAAALSNYLTHLPQTHFQTKSNRWTKWFLVGGQWEVGQFDGVTLHQSGFFRKPVSKAVSGIITCLVPPAPQKKHSALHGPGPDQASPGSRLGTTLS